MVTNVLWSSWIVFLEDFLPSVSSVLSGTPETEIVDILDWPSKFLIISLLFSISVLLLYFLWHSCTWIYSSSVLIFLDVIIILIPRAVFYVHKTSFDTEERFEFFSKNISTCRIQNKVPFMRLVFIVSGPAQEGSFNSTQLVAKTKTPLCHCQSSGFTGLHGTSQHCVLDQRKHHIWKLWKWERCYFRLTPSR